MRLLLHISIVAAATLALATVDRLARAGHIRLWARSVSLRSGDANVSVCGRACVDDGQNLWREQIIQPNTIKHRRTHG